ncbi:DUF305 domain-containing protein [Mycolicibacterium insubricum]|uniref:Uncharacterized protein n=1 Tax=Mycolicibacterium insubricum TaxID=444597 RepID=A0A1X0D572_9MYCO|nr:DUF305 domain-containing protein [Mycolicibacterium insubricum]MCV7081946.1 DUF305 domain-containing protein [Mycolicibacterium insubricum]ORA67332.1 hypothetical protein BST26_15950 [Mycolicibacterium insubricum]BBZ68158.1 DUF305 domain-containing protein [Mycolicibacterium insubricum]
MNTRGSLTRLLALLVAVGLGAGVTLLVTGGRETPAALLSDTDIGFAQDMSGHHQQAVTMSDMLSTDASPDSRALAEGIRFQQLTEIGVMTGWLQMAGAPPQSPHPMAWMHTGGTEHSGHGSGEHGSGAHTMSMPGLASAEDLKRLQRSTGHDNEVLFLQLMSRHHQGGIEMAGYAVQRTHNDAVRRVAAAMIDEQTQELQLMAIMLKSRGAEPLAYP